jgi:sugar/nucleoside kinase (ribokinase family)
MLRSRAVGLDVVGIGNALVDVLAPVDDAFLERFGLVRGTMALIDTERAEELYAAMPERTEMSGGQAANTMAGVASFGGRAGFIGRVADDDLGVVFAHDLEVLGVRFDVPVATGGPPTGRCLIAVSADGERTMNTFLGASSLLDSELVDGELVGSAQVVFLEGFLFDRPEAKEAYRAASRTAHAAGRKVALSLSDVFCVERHHDDFTRLVDEEVDILFANEQEIAALYGTTSFGASVDAVRGRCEVTCLTRGSQGSVIVAGDETHEVAPEPVERVVDTTGAGDLYAAGFLFGWTRGDDLPTCGRLGSVAAAAVIGHTGARPGLSLAQLL